MTIKSWDMNGALVAVHDNDGDVIAPTPKPKLADSVKVVIRQSGRERTYSLLVDGQEFPWYISDAGVETTASMNSIPAVRFTLLAESVEIVNDWRSPKSA